MGHEQILTAAVVRIWRLRLSDAFRGVLLILNDVDCYNIVRPVHDGSNVLCFGHSDFGLGQ